MKLLVISILSAPIVVLLGWMIRRMPVPKKMEEILDNPWSAEEEIRRLRAREAELLEANNRYQQEARDARVELQAARQSAIDAKKLCEKAIETANELGVEIHQVKRELEATGHAHKGEPLHILVDKAIDKERERMEAAFNAIIAAFDVSPSVVRALGMKEDSQIVEYIVSKVHEVRRLAFYFAYRHPELPKKTAAASGSSKAAEPGIETAVRNVEFEQMQEVLSKTVAAVHFLEQKVDQLMARADAEQIDRRVPRFDPKPPTDWDSRKGGL